VWFAPRTAQRAGESVGTSDGTLLSLPLPTFTEDLAGRGEPVTEFGLHRPRLGADGSFGAELVGEPGRTYSVEVSPDLHAWQDWTRLAMPAGRAVELRDPAAVQPARFYRARLED
jgi:hypothetical protein